MLFWANAPLHFRFLLKILKTTHFSDMLFLTNAPFHFRFLPLKASKKGGRNAVFEAPKWLQKLSKKCYFLVPFFDHFGDHFWGHFGGQFGVRIGPRGAKMGPRGTSRPPSSEKVDFQKCGFCIGKVHIFEIQGRPRQAWKAQEAAQERPGELSDLKKSRFKN